MKLANLLLAAGIFLLAGTAVQADVGSTQITGRPDSPIEQYPNNTSIYDLDKGPSPAPEPRGNMPGVIGDPTADTSAVQGPNANSYGTQGKPIYFD